jgi:hypothetical protein
MLVSCSNRAQIQKTENQETFEMKILVRAIALAVLASAFCMAQDVVEAVHGIVTKIDLASKTMVVKTKDGVEHTFHYVDKTVVKGADAAAAAAKEGFKGVKEGSEVVVQTAKKGSVDTADRIDVLSKDTARTVNGTLMKVGKGGKDLTIKTADGTQETFKTAGKGIADTAEELSKKTQQGAKITVIYTEDAGKKIAHFFEE